MANLITKIIISATDQASNVFDAIRRNASELATAVAGYFGIKLFSSSVDSARDFESAMSRVGAASGATAEELAQLKAAAEEAGASTQYTSVEAAAALENLAKAGLSASDAVATLPAVLDLATAGGVDLATSSDFISKAVAGMGLSFQDAGRVADVLAKGANASNTSVTGLAQALSYAAPLANSLGLSLEQTVAIIGKFADAGIDGSRAGTALNSTLAQFSNPASTFRRELASAGIITGDFDQALRQLAAAGPAGQKAILAVGQEAGPALRALLNQGIGSLDELKAKLDDSAGSARTFAAVMSDNLDGASKGLGSAWEALKIKLGEPILGPLKEQVDALAGRLREFVSNGTAVRFGESIASAFKAGAEWVQGFLETINFDDVSARMQAYAADARAFFDDFGQKATTAGNIAELAYNTMAAGFQSVMAVIYKLGEGMSWLTSVILAEVATIASGLSKITFGDLSQSFATAAQSIKLEAQAAYAVMEEFGKKSGEAFDAATENATRAAEAWDSLNAPVATATESIKNVATAADTTTASLGLTAEQLDALGENATVAGGKVVELGKQATASAAEQVTAADAARAKITELRAEYARLIEAGDTQGAAQKLVEIQAELDRTKDKAADAAEAVEAAFVRLGVTSTAALKQAADAAKRDFEIIKNSGTASTADIQAAFEVYAEKAIAANGGVADATLKAQAATVGMRIETDETGKVIVRTLQESRQAAIDLANATDEAASSMGELAEATEDVAGAQSSAASATDNLSSKNAVTTGTWMTAAGAASKYAEEARKAAWASRQTSTSISDLTASFAAYVAGMEALDRQQAAISSNGARGLEDLKLRYLELNGTEEEIAKARHRRDEADMQRQIALMGIEIERAARRGEDVSVLKDEIALMKEQLVWLDKIYTEEEKQRKAREADAEKEQRQREKDRRDADRKRNTDSASAGNTSSAGNAPAANTNLLPVKPQRTVNVNLNIGGKTIPVSAAESDATRLIHELETLERVST